MKQLEKALIRLAITGKLPFSRQFLAWSSKRHLADVEPTPSLHYAFEIPDLSQPIPKDERGMCGPSGHLIPFVPQELVAKQIIGRRVDEVEQVGTYGMGGPGFLGLRLEYEWLVIAIWGAGEWIRVDGTLVTDWFFDKHERSKPWIYDGIDDLSPKLVGAEIAALEIHQHSMDMSFSNGMSLTIDETLEDRALFEGNGKPREFLPDDDLRKAVFLAPTAEIWV